MPLEHQPENTNKLKQARLDKELSLRDIELATRIPTKYIRPAYYAVRFSVLDIYSEAPAFKVKLIARYYWSEIIKVHDFSNYISLLAIIISMLAIILPFIIRN